MLTQEQKSKLLNHVVVLFETVLADVAATCGERFLPPTIEVRSQQEVWERKKYEEIYRGYHSMISCRWESQFGYIGLFFYDNCAMKCHQRFVVDGRLWDVVFGVIEIENFSNALLGLQTGRSDEQLPVKVLST